jgi:ketosteroid isomerase-like protein
MSRNIEVVRSLSAGLDLAKLLAGDNLDLADLFDPSFVLHPPEQSPDVQTYRGLEGLLAYLAMQLDVWDDPSFETEQFIDGGDRVVVFGRFSVRGKGSGVPVTIPSAHVSRPVWRVTHLEMSGGRQPPAGRDSPPGLSTINGIGRIVLDW